MVRTALKGWSLVPIPRTDEERSETLRELYDVLDRHAEAAPDILCACDEERWATHDRLLRDVTRLVGSLRSDDALHKNALVYMTHSLLSLAHYMRFEFFSFFIDEYAARKGGWTLDEWEEESLKIALKHSGKSTVRRAIRAGILDMTTVKKWSLASKSKG